MTTSSMYNAIRSGDWVSFGRLVDGRMVKTYGYVVRVERLGGIATAVVSYRTVTSEHGGREMIWSAEVPLGLVRLED